MIEVSVITGVDGHSGTIPVTWGRFPCGERNVKVEQLKNVSSNMVFEQVTVHMKYQSDSDIIDLLLLCDAIKRSPLQYKQFILLLGYFPYSRQDRVCNQGEPHSLKVICSLINSCGFDRVFVIDPHSDVIEALLDKPDIVTIADIIFASEQAEFGEVDAYVSPDGGAYKKVTKAASIYGKPIVRADKIRDTQTGQLSGFEVYASDLSGQTVMIVDDICDGGGTFIGLAQKLRERGAEKVLLYVTHGMFTKGVDVLKESIDEILCYEYYGSPEDENKVTTVEYTMDDKIHHYTQSFIDQCDRVSSTYYKGCVESFQRMFDKMTDEERWKLIKTNRYLGFKVMLDNDETTVVFNQELMEDRCIEDWTGRFDAWIGNSPGVDILLDSVGIQNERY